MICPDCGLPALPTYCQHLRHCKAYAARMANGGRMVDVLRPVGKRLPTGELGAVAKRRLPRKCAESGCIIPPRNGCETCTKHAPKVKRRADGMCQLCGLYPRYERNSYCKACKAKKARIALHAKKAGK